MSQYKIGLDLDGVTGKYEEAFRAHVAAVTGRAHSDLPSPTTFSFVEAGWCSTTDEYFALHAGAVNNGMFRNMSIYAGATDAVKRLREKGIRVEVVTSRFLPGTDPERVMADTKAWLAEHGIEYDDIHFTDTKADAGCDLYIDDAPHNIVALQASGKQTIIFEQQYNVDCLGDRVKDWDELEKLVLREKNRHTMREFNATRASPHPSYNNPTVVGTPREQNPATMVKTKRCRGRRTDGKRCERRGMCPHHG